MHQYLLRNGEILKMSKRGLEVGRIRHPLEGVKGATAKVLSRGMSVRVPGAPLRLEFTDRKTREAAMEALAGLLGGKVVRKGGGLWAKVEVDQNT